MSASSSRNGSNRRSTRRRVPRPQVFISFRGDEVRDNFVNQLVTSLRFRNINVFIDSFLRGGLRLEHLLTKIEESKIAVVIFSKRFTESYWCMDELVRMDERASQGRLVVIPVFYGVSTNEVQNLEGDFGRNFEELRIQYADSEPEKVLNWEASVKSIANTKGLVSNNNGRIAPPLVHQIAGVVQEWLNEMPGGMSPPKKTTTLDVFFCTFVVSVFLSLICFPLYIGAKFSTVVTCVCGFPTLAAFLFYIINNWGNKNNQPPGTRPTPSTTRLPPPS